MKIYIKKFDNGEITKVEHFVPGSNTFNMVLVPNSMLPCPALEKITAHYSDDCLLVGGSCGSSSIEIVVEPVNDEELGYIKGVFLIGKPNSIILNTDQYGKWIMFSGELLPPMSHGDVEIPLCKSCLSKLRHTKREDGTVNKVVMLR